MDVCDMCSGIDGRPNDVQRQDSLVLIGIAECNGTLALEHYRCTRCQAVIARRFMGDAHERIWSVIDAAH